MSGKKAVNTGRQSSGSGRQTRGRNSAAGFYVDGNTVRKTAPRSVPAERTGNKKDAERLHREQRRIARNREKALAMDVPYLVVLTAAVLMTLYICYSYLCLQSSISAHMDNVEQMETRLETLRAENDALESGINTSIELNYVYNVAINELGMVHAGKDSIINFDKTESEYVRQYEDISE